MDKSFTITALPKGGYVVFKNAASYGTGAYNPPVLAASQLDEVLAFIKAEMESKAIELP